MNDFTIEDLTILKNGVDYLPFHQQLNLSNQYINKCKDIGEKLKSMIDNYCEHELQSCCGKYTSVFCNKCDKEFIIPKEEK